MCELGGETEKMDPYGLALEEDHEGFLDYFHKRTAKDLLDYRTVNGERAIHIAASMESPELMNKLLVTMLFTLRRPADTRLEALMGQTDAFGNNALHEAAIVNDVHVARVLVYFARKSGPEAYKNLLEAKNSLGETPIYRAAALGKTKLLQNLVGEGGVLGQRHSQRGEDDISILHIAVLGQHFDTAIWLLKQDTSLADKLTSKITPNSKKQEGLTCLQLLALMPSAFKSDSTTTATGIWTSLVSSCLPTFEDDYDYSYKEDLETGKIDNGIWCTNRRRGISIRKVYFDIWRQVIEGRPAIKKLWMKKQMHKNADALLEKLVEIETRHFRNRERNREISSLAESPKSTKTISLGYGKGDIISEKKLVDFSAGELGELLVKKIGDMIKAKKLVDFSVREFAELLMKKHCTKKADNNHEDYIWAMRKTLRYAASNGIIEVLKEIKHQYPEAMLLDNLNDKNQNILHVAVKRRQHKVFEFIRKEMKPSVPKWASRIDSKGYTLLHHVANMKYYKEGTRPGPVLQFQEELKLFESVKEIVPPHYAMHRDKKKNMTADDLFKATHEDQLKKAQEWIKETSQACSVLAILVATVCFTAAFTIPGGNNDKGFPIFLKAPLFYFFTVMDVASLSLSLSSAVMFLSILTSPRESSDFLSDLPHKLVVGFTLLFFSVLTSMITFSASLLLIIRMETKWTAALYAAAILPVIVLALMEFPYCAHFLANGKVCSLEFRNVFPSMNKKKKTKKMHDV